MPVLFFGIRQNALVRCSSSRWIAAVIGSTAIALGLMVLIGWHAHLPGLIQLRPTLAPMTYNTAVCFLVTGCGLWSLVWARTPVAQAFGGIVAAVGALTLLEYLFHIDLGIDQLLFPPYLTDQTSYPGRMSPFTALCFVQLGLVLLMSGLRSRSNWWIGVIGSLGAVVMAICVMAILGYLIGLPGTYGWGRTSRISIHAALGLGILGAGFFALAWKARHEPGQRSPRWLPVPVGLGLFVATLVLWQALDAKQNQQIAGTVRAGAESATNQIRAHVDARIRAFQRMAHRWEFSGRPSQAAWEDDAKNYVAHFPDVQALEWIDAAHLVQWVFPLKGNEAKLDRNLTLEPTRKKAVESAQANHQPALTGTVNLLRGGLGYVTYIPIVTGSEFDGFIAAIFPAQAAFDQYLPPSVAEGDTILLSHGGQTFYERNPSALPSHPEWIADSRVELFGATWDVRVWPTPAFVAKMGGPLPEIALAIGFIGALLLAFTTFLVQSAAAKAQKIAALYQTLLAAQAEVKTLSGLLPICAECKRIKDEEGHWNRMERYVSKRSEASFSHGYCPQCAVQFCQESGIAVPVSIRAEMEEGRFDP